MFIAKLAILVAISEVLRYETTTADDSIIPTRWLSISTPTSTQMRFPVRRHHHILPLRWASCLHLHRTGTTVELLVEAIMAMEEATRAGEASRITMATNHRVVNATTIEVAMATIKVKVAIEVAGNRTIVEADIKDTTTEIKAMVRGLHLASTREEAGMRIEVVTPTGTAAAVVEVSLATRRARMRSIARIKASAAFDQVMMGILVEVLACHPKA